MNSRLYFFENWLEIKTHPLFQLHKFTDSFIAILEKADYGEGDKKVEAIQVEAIDGYDSATERVLSVFILLKAPLGKGINSRGMLVHVRPESRGVEEALALQIFGRPMEPKLIMNSSNRVMSITDSHVRLCPSGTMMDSHAWGEFDRRFPDGYLAEPPATDLAALLSLAP